MVVQKRRACISALHKRVEAMEKVGAGALADQVLRKLVRLQLQKYAQHLTDARRELEPFEQRYGLSSEACHRRFMAGDMGDAADVIEWMGLYDNVLLYQERMHALQAAAEA